MKRRARLSGRPATKSLRVAVPEERSTMGEVESNVFGKSLVFVGALLCSCMSSDPEPGADDPIPPIDAEAPQVFETATFASG